MRSTRRTWAIAIVLSALSAGVLHFHLYSAEDKRLAVYAPGARWVLNVSDIEGRPYIAFDELLGHLGGTLVRAGKDSARLKLDRNTGEFTDGSDRVRFGRVILRTQGNVFLRDGHALVPLTSTPSLLKIYLGSEPELHLSGRRLFLPGTQAQAAAELKKGDSSALVLSFPNSVAPSVHSEGGKLRLSFHREPVVFYADKIDYPDKLFQSLSFSENNGEAEMVIQGATPLLANFSDNGRTITITPAPAAPVVAQAPTTASPSPETQPTQPPESAPNTTPPTTPSLGSRLETPTHFFVAIDPSHGGDDDGVRFSDKLVEKDITLALARRLKQNLEDEGISAVLLRDTDASIPLGERAGVVNARHAGMYISLHAGGPGKGARIYTALLSPEVGTDNVFIPWERGQSLALSRSIILANSVAASLGEKKIDSQLMPAAVAPLSSIAVPAVAVEVAPPKGGANWDAMAAPAYQNTAMQAVARAVVTARKHMQEGR